MKCATLQLLVFHPVPRLEENNTHAHTHTRIKQAKETAEEA